MRHSFLIFVFLGPFLASCGYSLQNSHNDLYVKEDIQRVFVSPIINNSYKAGVENVVYNSLIRTLLAHRRIVLVHNREGADAVLEGTVQNASYGSSFATAVSDLAPKNYLLRSGLPTLGFPISTEYTATLSCSFSLTRSVIRPGKRTAIWSSGFSRNKPFPGANQLDVPGTTSALINDSEFDRALADASSNMMEDVHESMLAMF